MVISATLVYQSRPHTTEMLEIYQLLFFVSRWIKPSSVITSPLADHVPTSPVRYFDYGQRKSIVSSVFTVILQDQDPTALTNAVYLFYMSPALNECLLFAHRMRLLLLRTGSHQLLRSITRVHSKENDVHGDIVAHVAAQWRLDAHDSFEQPSPVAAQGVLDEMHADVLIFDDKVLRADAPLEALFVFVVVGIRVFVWSPIGRLYES